MGMYNKLSLEIVEAIETGATLDDLMDMYEPLVGADYIHERWVEFNGTEENLDIELEESYDEEDDGQPDEYTEWQDYYGGDDWDQGQYDY